MPLEKIPEMGVLVDISSYSNIDIRQNDKGEIPIINKIENILAECLENNLISDATICSNEAQSKALWSIREAGAEVKHTFVIFYYDIFKDTIEKLKEKDLALHYLATWWDVLNYAKKTSKFDNKTLASVEDYLNNPIDWSNKNGGK